MTTFKEIKIGNPFIYNGAVFLKDSRTTALFMPTGLPIEFKPDTKVSKP